MPGTKEYLDHKHKRSYRTGTCRDRFFCLLRAVSLSLKGSSSTRMEMTMRKLWGCVIKLAYPLNRDTDDRNFLKSNLGICSEVSLKNFLHMFSEVLSCPCFWHGDLFPFFVFKEGIRFYPNVMQVLLKKMLLLNFWCMDFTIKVRLIDYLFFFLKGEAFS